MGTSVGPREDPPGSGIGRRIHGTHRRVSLWRWGRNGLGVLHLGAGLDLDKKL